MATAALAFNLDEEVRLATSNADRERIEELANLYSLIVSLDGLERAYVCAGMYEAACTIQDDHEACGRLCAKPRGVHARVPDGLHCRGTSIKGWCTSDRRAQRGRRRVRRRRDGEMGRRDDTELHHLHGRPQAQASRERPTPPSPHRPHVRLHTLQEQQRVGRPTKDLALAHHAQPDAGERGDHRGPVEADALRRRERLLRVRSYPHADSSSEY
ncbi:vacuolar protein sorting-associated protein [Rhodotorula toruloides NP11]|uniref:Vacuolar protein sorting-associated protein n=1 Tax=Rhodotorula toruloides (strain NP11) TaxID=1130832 RepID=M7WM69_RHOT1|nr:vacuolar protein sorting-associated protein [Rhodotorula toruloides NP11]EMS21602.1 vacuolar protein sorting-associated protein [Rhodotorula toruloides NP11]